ncbi:MAG TPA: metal-dependent transcriptional regulator [Thermotogota bacterium]|nr:metal-dependent transcriptional regulator [Thermotogota bacterium]NLH19325.1 metal-dependent transcriptional regulator [Thermotogaceae bacterium]OQC32263.1 MAG: Transcriptional regulator MntR [Thermotogota bacterium ADurb.Bin062]HNW46105.1 metal-dependent transcriptional regulator [Thermotogota bacterium]HNY81965.1 metal-dependent transcriptional regulator [Thermotogota bacterium]
MTRGRKKVLTSALEDYIKVIFDLTQAAPVARVKDIAESVGVSLPSVTNAMKRLKDLGYVNYEKYGLIYLSEEGKKRAITLIRVHQLLDAFFVDLVGMPANVSSNLSCRIEHFLDQRTEERSARFITILKKIKTGEPEAYNDLERFLQEKPG